MPILILIKIGFLLIKTFIIMNNFFWLNKWYIFLKMFFLLWFLAFSFNSLSMADEYFYDYNVSKANDEIPNSTTPQTFRHLVTENQKNIANVIDYTNIADSIITQNNINISQLPIWSKEAWTFYEIKNPYIFNGYEEWADIYFKNGIIGNNRRQVVNQYSAKNVVLFPYMNLFIPAQKIPILIYINNNKLSNDALITTKVFISNKEFQANTPKDLDNIGVVAQTEFQHKNNSVWYTVFDIKKIFDNSVIPEKGSIYLYTYSVDWEWHKTNLEKRKIDYIASDLELVAEVWENVIEFEKNNKKEYRTRSDYADATVYSNMQLRTINSNKYNIVMLESERLSPEKTIKGKNYEYKYMIRIMWLLEGENDIPLTWLSVYGWQKTDRLTIFRDSTAPYAVKYRIQDEFRIEKDSIVYLNTPVFKKKGSFDFLFHPDDWNGIWTQQVIVKTELWKRIYNLNDKQDNILDNLQINNENGDRIFMFELSDFLWNVRTLEYRFRYLDVSFPIFLYPSQNNVIVTDNQINFIGFCSGIKEWEVKFKMNGGTESEWIKYTDTWNIAQILQRWSNEFQIKCRNIVWLESDWGERTVIYSPITKIGWTNSLLQIYSTIANWMFMNRWNKNVNNDSLQVITPEMKNEIPWFQK